MLTAWPLAKIIAAFPCMPAFASAAAQPEFFFPMSLVCFGELLLPGVA